MPWPNRPRRHPPGSAGLGNGLARGYLVSSLLLTSSQRPASGTSASGKGFCAEHTGPNLGGVEIRGKLGKEFTVKPVK